MTTTARFELQRRKQLHALFTKKRLVTLWRKLVRQQLRKLEITDLHDYYDFNVNIEERALEIIEKIDAGLYRAESPLIYRVEKKMGICRHMLVPSPSDALVFQILTDELHEQLVKRQPSPNAYYSRDRHSIPLPHAVPEAKSYPWFVLWPKFQEDIWGFSRSHKYLVTTDLSNYYDNIGLRELRHVISALAETQEVYLDLLFSLIEDLSWSPDYLPRSHKGLPTINIEAPRLLAHALLFEVDYVLKRRTRDSFVRWMDDINFGIDSKRKAHVVLGELNDVLKSRGLALNLAKTEIIASNEAANHFLFRENKVLTTNIDKARRLKTPAARDRHARKAAREFYSHLRTCEARNRDKLTKRYFTLFRSLKTPRPLKKGVDIFLESPGIRSSVLYYIPSIPFTKPAGREILRLVDDLTYFDDVTMFQLTGAIVAWAVPPDYRGRWFISELAGKLRTFKTPFGWLCLVNLLSKYGEPHEVMTAVANLRKFDVRDGFFHRQAMAALTRAVGINSRVVRRQWNEEIAKGHADSKSVASNLKLLLDSPFPAKSHRLYKYLFPDKKQTPYPLPKFLILCLLAKSDADRSVTKKRPELDTHVGDPWFRLWLGGINPLWA